MLQVRDFTKHELSSSDLEAIDAAMGSIEESIYSIADALGMTEEELSGSGNIIKIPTELLEYQLIALNRTANDLAASVISIENATS